MDIRNARREAFLSHYGEERNRLPEADEAFRNFAAGWNAACKILLDEANDNTRELATVIDKAEEALFQSSRYAALAENLSR